jgi:hypothetical protein
MKGSVPIDSQPWKLAKPIKGFVWFIELFRRNKENEKKS